MKTVEELHKESRYQNASMKRKKIINKWQGKEAIARQEEIRKRWEATNYGIDYAPKLFEYIMVKNLNTQHDCFFACSRANCNMNLISIDVYVGGFKKDVENKFTIKFLLHKLNEMTLKNTINMVEYGIGLYQEKGIIFNGDSLFDLDDLPLDFLLFGIGRGE